MQSPVTEMQKHTQMMIAGPFMTQSDGYAAAESEAAKRGAPVYLLQRQGTRLWEVHDVQPRDQPSMRIALPR